MGSTYGGGVNATDTDLSLERVNIVGNTAAFGGGIAMGAANRASVHALLVDCSVLHNTSTGSNGDPTGAGGGAVLGFGNTLESIDTDWGSGATDNSAEDIGWGGEAPPPTV